MVLRRLFHFKRVLGTEPSIFWFVVRRVLRGALILGIAIGVLNAIQAAGYASVYDTAAERAGFAATLAQNPGLGLLYGPAVHLTEPSGYIVYRCLSIVSLIAALWGLMFITKMLRGQEEDGRWEQLLSGQTTTRRMTFLVIAGALVGVVIAFVIASSLLALLGSDSHIGISFGDALYYSLALVVAAVPFMALGAVTSQLAATRRLAILYGVVPLVGFFVLRGISNTSNDFSWFRDFTPFGWIENMSPIFSPKPGWLLLIGVVSAIGIAVSIYLAGRRDEGESLIAAADTHKPRYTLVKGPFSLTLRLQGPLLIAWLIGCISVMSLLAAIAKIAAESSTNSSSLKASLSALTGDQTQSFALAFIGIGSVLLATVLMAMMAVSVAAIRNEEARGLLDNFLIHPLGRLRWLGSRLVITAAAALGICVISYLVGYIILTNQGIEVDFWRMLGGGVSLLGSVAFMLGLGILLYGLLPRFAVVVMYLVIVWSFVVEMIQAVVKLDDLVQKSSLLHYVAVSPAVDPDWSAFAILVATGVILMLGGMYLFNRRDLEAE